MEGEQATPTVDWNNFERVPLRVHHSTEYFCKRPCVVLTMVVKIGRQQPPFNLQRMRAGSRDRSSVWIRVMVEP